MKALIAVTLVGVSLFLANVVGFRGVDSRGDTPSWQFGWPTIYKFRRCTFHDYFALNHKIETSRFLFGTKPYYHDHWWLWEQRVLALNVFCALLIVGCTYIVTSFERFSAFPRQWTLRQLLVVTTFVSIVLGLICSGPLPWWPAMTWKPLVFFPVLFGLVCTALVIDWGLAELAGAIRRKGGRPTTRPNPSDDSPAT